LGDLPVGLICRARGGAIVLAGGRSSSRLEQVRHSPGETAFNETFAALGSRKAAES
jgi:hypothetical protein